MSDLILAVTKVEYSVAKKIPPFLVISVEGTISNPGWKNRQLVFKGLENGVLEYDFVGERQSGQWPQITQVVHSSIEYHGDVDAIKTIRVNSQTNTIERTVGEDDAANKEEEGFYRFLPLSNEIDGDRDPIAFAHAVNELEDLPLAKLHRVVAIKTDSTLLIYVEGFTPGFGGKLIVEKRPERILPTLFHIHASPGSEGTKPDPRYKPTIAACSFDAAGIGDSILIEGADERVEVKVIKSIVGITL